MPIRAEEAAEELAYDRYRAGVLQHEGWQRRSLRDAPANAHARQRHDRARELLGKTMLHLRSS